MKPGETIGQYEIESILGRGGMGTVYAVKHLVLGGRHALKILHPEVSETPEGRERFRREARVMHDLGKAHPHILEVEEYGEEPDGTLWLKMPLMPGMAGKKGRRWVTLQDRMDAEGRLPEQEGQKLLEQILDGLGYAHQQGALHRDLKPANILLDEDGSARISDFGLVKVVEGKWLQSQFEKSVFRTAAFGETLHAADGDPGASTEALVGTWTYLAPEVKKGAEATAASDLWPVGLLAFQLLTGRETPGFEPPSRVVPGLNPMWDSLIPRATAENPAERFASAEKFAKAIRGGTASAAKSRRWPLWAGASAVAVAVMLGLIVLEHFRGGKTPPSQGGSDDKGQAAAQGNPGSGEEKSTVTTTGPEPGEPDASVTENEPPDDQTVHASVSNDVVNPAGASKDRPFVNSLGMKFVPVAIEGGPTKGQRVLFSVWETRVQDYEAFAAETPRIDPWWKDFVYRGYEQGADHPVMNIRFGEAYEFCEWLTKRERTAGRIGPDDAYRLPTDAEWSFAVGIGDREDADAWPNAKNAKIADEYPWGAQWPPPDFVGNYADIETHEPFGFTVIEDYEDGFPFTARVGSFPANENGIHDLGGNVHEWCLGLYGNAEEEGDYGVLRGGSWDYYNPELLLSSFRLKFRGALAMTTFGFRCVLELSVKSRPPSQTAVPPSTEAITSAKTPGEASKDQPFVNSLGMRFVPVEIGAGPSAGRSLLFSVWETRVQDYKAFAQKNPGIDMTWENLLYFGPFLGHPPFQQGADHPVHSVSWNDAVAFCSWLTESERAAGRIGKNDQYRLPTDLEWSYAVGIGDSEDASADPEGRWRNGNEEIFPWGRSWPPPIAPGNYKGREVDSDSGYDLHDNHIYTAPVGSYESNDRGIYDLGGNIREWCEDSVGSMLSIKIKGETKTSRVLRGGCYFDTASIEFANPLLSSYRTSLKPETRFYTVGFRVVLTLSASH